MGTHRTLDPTRDRGHGRAPGFRGPRPLITCVRCVGFLGSFPPFAADGGVTTGEAPSTPVGGAGCGSRPHLARLHLAALDSATLSVPCASARDGHSPRGILKTERRPSRVGTLQWDERSLAEQSLERGTRQRIDEPKTPYHWSRSPAFDSDDSESAAGRAASSGPCCASSTPPFPPPPFPPFSVSHSVCVYVGATSYRRLLWQPRGVRVQHASQSSVPRGGRGPAGCRHVLCRRRQRRRQRRRHGQWQRGEGWCGLGVTHCHV